MKNISSIRSPHFTTVLPNRSKFKLGEQVRLIKLTMYSGRVTHPALKRYGAGTLGTVVGMNYKKGNYMRCYPYYVQFDDGQVFPIKPCYIEKKDPKIARAGQERNKKRRDLRKAVEGCVRDLLKTRQDFLMVSDYQFTDKAIAQIRKIYE